MNVQKMVMVLFLLIGIQYSTHMFAVVIGSTSAVSVESFYTFPTGDDDNQIIGFAWLNSGFALQDALTTCTFGGVFPVSGTLNLNGGTLTLGQDLILHNIINMQGLGNIVGGGYAMDLCYSVSFFPLIPIVLRI